MPLTPDEAEALAQVLNARMGLGRIGKPKLRLVVPPTAKLLDPIFRENHLKRILFLQRAYGLQWLVDQECFDVPSLSCMEDCDLIRLLSLMERARECIMDGVTFDDAGLVKYREKVDPDNDDPPRDLKSTVRQVEYAEMAVAKLRRESMRPTHESLALTHEEPPF